MDMGINDVSRIIGRTDPESELKKKPQAVEKTAEARSVSENEATDQAKATSDEQKIGEPPEKGIDRAGLEELAGKINELFQVESRSLQFNVDEASGRTVIKVVDKTTGEEIKQIPAEELLEISRRLAAQLEGDNTMASGVLIKSKA
ncbi:MAG: flagellar protein FlaG [Gammaproteobacteria bacterium]